MGELYLFTHISCSGNHDGRLVSLETDLQEKNLRKNPKFSISFSSVYLKFIPSYTVKIFIDFTRNLLKQS